jgi:hypothetical protein
VKLELNVKAGRDYDKAGPWGEIESCVKKSGNMARNSSKTTLSERLSGKKYYHCWHKEMHRPFWSHATYSVGNT